MPTHAMYSKQQSIWIMYVRSHLKSMRMSFLLKWQYSYMIFQAWSQWWRVIVHTYYTHYITSLQQKTELKSVWPASSALWRRRATKWPHVWSPWWRLTLFPRLRFPGAARDSFHSQTWSEPFLRVSPGWIKILSSFLHPPQWTRPNHGSMQDSREKARIVESFGVDFNYDSRPSCLPVS